MSFVINRIVLRPTLTAHVEFSEVADAESYVVTAVDSAGGLTPDTVIATVMASPASLAALAFGKTYSVTVAALDSDDDPISETDSVSLSTANTFSRVGFIRQRLFEILNGAAITLDGKRLHVYADQYARPRILVEQDAVAARLPACEIQHLRLVDGRIESIRSVESYEVGIRVFVGASDPDQGLERAYIAMENIRWAIDGTSMLGMSGVHNGAWSWATRGEPEYEKNVVSAELLLRLTVQSAAGAGVYALTS